MTDREAHNEFSHEDAQASLFLTSRSDDDDSFAPPIPTGEGEILGPPLTILPPNTKPGDAVKALSKDIPQNQFGMPQFFIRSDLINTASGCFGPEELDAASIPLFYHEGYPTLESGQAFWNQLPHEPYESHLLFRRYIDQAEDTGIRQLELLSVAEDTPLEDLRQLFLEFYWSVRARAYDLFIVAAERKKREFRTRKMEATHFDKAQGLLDKLAHKFEDEDWLEELNAKEAIEALVELAKLQRLSMGLTGNNSSSLPKNPLPEGASTQQLMEHLTKGTTLSNSDTTSFGARLDAILADEESGYAVQEAIIRISRGDATQHSSDAYSEE